MRNFGADNNLADFATQFDSLGNLITDTTPVATWSGAFELNDITGAASAAIASPTLTDTGGWSKVHETGFASVGTESGGDDPRYRPTFDQRGFARFADGTGNGSANIDAGPYELKAAFHDSDRDQIPDWWECRYWFDPTDPDDADDNPDRDAYDNLNEFRNETHPRLYDVISAVPVFLSITHDHQSGTTVLTFTGPPGEAFELIDSNDLANWSDFGNGTFDGGVQGLRFAAPQMRHFYKFKEE